MIRVIYKKAELYTPWRVFWTSLVFLAINYLVFVAFMNVCFQNLGIKQPLALIIICLGFLAVDLAFKVFMTRKAFSFGNLIDLIVIFSLILSFSLYSLFHNLIFLQIIALLKLKDIAYFNVMVYNLVKKYRVIFKTYVILKITYWIILGGHLMGCIFYAVDNYLIKTQQFGPLSLYPNNYYQGSEHVFTSIYSLSEELRYVYAIYYSFALISTCAFGDIIGHNYYEDIMVCCFLIISTIAISLIIEQMYIVFRRQKTMYYDLVTRLKYVSEYIKTQPNISNEFRHQLINYMINSQWKQKTSTPDLTDLTYKLQKNLFSESILLKSESILYKRQNSLPLIIQTHFLPFLKAKYFPANYYLIDNNRLQNHIDGRIILNAKVNVGYTKQLIGKRYIQSEAIHFGFDDLVINTNCLQRYLTVQLVEQSQVFILNDNDFLNKMNQLKDYVNEYLPTPVEFFQISKDTILNNTFDKNYCFQCNQNGHTLIDCQKFHYNPRNIRKFDMYLSHYQHERQQFRRRSLRSSKNTSMKSFDQMKRQKQGLPNLAIHFAIIKKMFDQNNIFQNLLQKTIVNYTQDNLINSNDRDQVDSYHVWKIYAPSGKI